MVRACHPGSFGPTLGAMTPATNPASETATPPAVALWVSEVTDEPGTYHAAIATAADMDSDAALSDVLLATAFAPRDRFLETVVETLQAQCSGSSVAYVAGPDASVLPLEALRLALIPPPTGFSWKPGKLFHTGTPCALVTLEGHDVAHPVTERDGDHTDLTWIAAPIVDHIGTLTDDEKTEWINALEVAADEAGDGDEGDWEAEAPEEQPWDCHGLTLYKWDGEEYAVGTEEEADAAVRSYIEDSVWAFVPSFLVGYLPEGIDVETIEALQQRCESANGPLLALLKAGRGLDALVEGAVDADGRGHFLAPYDFEERDASEIHSTFGADTFAYRVN